ncbi:hypothetical protein SAMN04487968_106224 [Nocardioides terrae]|uniref:Uncharacterized protein n=1 Tax=Nocardioides terrae TaxID=574651 RepID=A0A1I1J893_9ACTN|nr:hypothetical protein [Nocardioides terrae]SFC44774.1 hypothetical protein SAMN04487968_106224 [Nocardioides terrae]
MTALAWRAPARASVCGPSGWVPVERLEVVRPGGQAYVRVESTPVGADADLEALVAATDHFPGAVDGGLATTVVLGAPGQSRTMTWSENGCAMSATIRYGLHDGRFVVLTSVLPDGNAATAAEAEAILGSVRFVTPAAGAPEVLPVRENDRADWTTVTRLWQGNGTVSRSQTYTITSEEAFGAAQHFGVTLLPGSDPSVLDGLDPAARDAVTSASWRSLVARGADTDPCLREALELAASHDLLVVLAADDALAWFAARPQRMVVISRGTRPHELELAVHGTGELATRILAATARSRGSVRLRSAYRVAGAVTGAEAGWHQTDPSGPTAHPRRTTADGSDLSTDDIRRLLGTLLPAGAH